MIEIENQKIEKEQTIKQNELLEEAKKEFLLKKRKQQELQNLSKNKLKQVHKEVENLAQKYTLNYFHSKFIQGSQNIQSESQ